jgi:hypothetical protein
MVCSVLGIAWSAAQDARRRMRGDGGISAFDQLLKGGDLL